MSTVSPKYLTVARVGEIEEGRGASFDVEGRAIAVFLSGGIYYAMADACPHQGAPLSDGTLECGVVACAWHDWRFNLSDGRSLDRPRVRVRTYHVRVVEDEIQVALE